VLVLNCRVLQRLACLALVLGALPAPAFANIPSQAPPPTIPTAEPEVTPAQVFVKDTHDSDELLEFDGNLVFNDFAYRAILVLPKGAAADAKTARLVVLQLTRFLKKAGYDLAQVDAKLEDGVIKLNIDEGHLDRVVITGESAVNTVRLRLQLQLASDVFNRPELEQRLRALSKRMGLTDASYTLVKTKDAEQKGLRILQDIEALAELREAGLLAEPGIYELHISIRQGSWGKGFSPEIALGGLDGLGLGGRFYGSRLLPIDDRWETRVRLGINTLPTLDGSGTQLVLSRVLGEANYWSAPLAGNSFRPGLLISSDLLEQSRRDIGYALFRRETLQAAIGVGDAVTDKLFFAVGLGAQARWFMDLDVDIPPTLGHPGVPLQPEIPRQLRPMLLSTLRYTLDPKELRVDFRNPASFTAQVFRDAALFSYRLDAAVDHATPLGWDEVRWEAHAFALGGTQQFFDEETLSDYMHGVFNDIFTKHLIEAGCEYRYSIFRDQLKLGVLAHLLTYGTLNATPGLPEQASFAGSIGLGAHSLFWDAIEVDVNFSVGHRSNGATSPALNLNLVQVY
jgi:hypothetical protein